MKVPVSRSILDIADQYLEKIKRSGNENIMAVCPFHLKEDGSEERNPSFSMNIYSGLWHCFSCHASGNLYTFLRDVGVSRAQISMQYGSAIEKARQYAPSPKTPRDLQGEYAVRGGILQESLLGLFDYCPVMLLEQGYPQTLLRSFDIGFDTIHERITFPLRDLQGRLVGINGRTVYPNVKPRYKVYDVEYKKFGLEERHTEKSMFLWNMHLVYSRLYQAPSHERMLVVTEGFKATMRLVQAGVHHTVAALGSSLSSIQRWLISSLGARTYLMFDNNPAGRLGCIKAGLELIKEVPFLFVPVYAAEQPSDLTCEAVADAIADSIPWTVWYQNQSSVEPPFTPN